MKWLHERRDWPHLVWDPAVLAAPLADVRHRQGLLLGRMQGLGFSLQEEALLQTLTSDVVESSSIEGEHLDPAQVRSSVARRLGIDVGGLVPADRHVEGEFVKQTLQRSRRRSERKRERFSHGVREKESGRLPPGRFFHTLGVVEMMVDATRNHRAPLDAERLFAWHAAVFPTGFSGMRRIAVGRWRSSDVGPMQVVSGPIGRERVHFEAPEASRLDEEMESFLTWFESEDPSLDPVLRAGLAHLRFVTIHPFEDGNGRIARAIADLALARSEDTPLRFYSMSSQLRMERKTYYQQLETTQRGDVDVTGWLAFFLACLARAIERAELDLAQVLRKAAFWERHRATPISERQRMMLGRLLDGFQGKLTSSKWAKLAKVSDDTALRDINDLIEKGILVRAPGGGRSTSYLLADETPASR